MSSTSTQDPSQALPPETFLEVLSASHDPATMARSSGVNRRWREIILSSISKYQDLSVEFDLERDFDLYEEEQKQGLGHKGKAEREEKEFERCSTLMRDLSDRSFNKLISVDLRLDSLFWYKFDLQFHQGSHLEKIFNTLLLSKVTLQTLSIHFKEEYEWEQYGDEEWIFLIDFLENFPNLKSATLKAPSPLILKSQRLTIEPTTNEFAWDPEDILPIFKRAAKYAGAVQEFSLWTETGNSNAKQELEFLQELMLYKDTLEVLDLVSLQHYEFQKSLELIVNCPKLKSLSFPQSGCAEFPVKFEVMDRDLATPPLTKFHFKVELRDVKILWNAPLVKWLGQKVEILHLKNSSSDSKIPFMPSDSLFTILKNNSHCLKELSLDYFFLEGTEEAEVMTVDSPVSFPNLKSLSIVGAHEPRIFSFFSHSKLPSISKIWILDYTMSRSVNTSVNDLSVLLRLLQSSSSTLQQVCLTEVQVIQSSSLPFQSIFFPKLTSLNIQTCSEGVFQAALSFRCPQLCEWYFINNRFGYVPKERQTLSTFTVSGERVSFFLSSSQSSIKKINVQGVGLEDSNSQQLFTFTSLESLDFEKVNDPLVKFFSVHSYPALSKLKEKQKYETFTSIFTPKVEQDPRRN